MSEQEGVAQQAIKRAKTDNLLRPRDRDFLVMGMELMQQGLSAEARRALHEMEVNHRVASKNGHKESMGLIREDIMLLTEFCQRLGLDLKPEDSDE